MATFKEFLQEDATTDVAKIQSDIAQLDAAILQKTAPLTAQRQRLQKMLVIKQKQKEQEDKQKGQQPNQQQPNQQQMVAPGTGQVPTQ